MTQESSGPIPWPSEVAQLLALTAFGFTLPLFRLADRHPDYFSHYYCDALDITIATAALFVLPPLFLAALSRLLPARIARPFLIGVKILLATVVFMGLLGPGMFVVALVGGLILAAVLTRLPAALLAIAAALVPIYFLTLSTIAVMFFGDWPEPPPPPPVKPIPVVLYLVDELPLTSMIDASGEIDARLFPSFARLRNQSTWFRNATAVNPYTYGAIPAILTGRYTDNVTPPSALVYPENLFTLFRSEDVLEAYEFGTRMMPLREGTRRRFEGARLDRLGSIAVDVARLFPLVFTGETTEGRRLTEVSQRLQLLTGQKFWFADLPSPVEYMESFLSHLDGKHEGGFYFFHNGLPHPPWHMLPRGGFYEANALDGYTMEVVPIPGHANRGVKEMTWTGDEGLVHLGYQRHLLQAMFVDAQLGRLLDRLEETGLGDRAMVIVTSDHGAYYGAHRKIRAYVGPGSEPVSGPNTEPSYAFLHCIPLFIKTPGQKEGRVTDINAEHVDIAPTVAQQLGVELPWKHDGHSLLDPAYTGRPLKRGVDAFSRKIEMEPVIERKLADARSRRAWFHDVPPEDPFPWYYRPLPYGAHVGAAVKVDTLIDATDVTATLEVPGTDGRPAWAKPGNHGYLKGCLHSPRLASEHLWIAVVRDGRVIAVTRSGFTGSTSSPFLALFPETIDGGDPAPEIHLITSPPGAPLKLERVKAARGDLSDCFRQPVESRK